MNQKLRFLSMKFVPPTNLIGHILPMSVSLMIEVIVIIVINMIGRLQ